MGDRRRPHLPRDGRADRCRGHGLAALEPGRMGLVPLCSDALPGPGGDGARPCRHARPHAGFDLGEVRSGHDQRQGAGRGRRAPRADVQERLSVRLRPLVRRVEPTRAPDLLGPDPPELRRNGLRCLVAGRVGARARRRLGRIAQAADRRRTGRGSVQLLPAAAHDRRPRRHAARHARQAHIDPDPLGLRRAAAQRRDHLVWRRPGQLGNFPQADPGGAQLRDERHSLLVGGHRRLFRRRCARPQV